MNGGRADAAADPPVREGTLRAPRRWERLIVEASVVGGLDRWRRRLRGLDAQLRQELEALEREEEPGARKPGIERDLRDLGSLRGYALPLLEALEALPRAAPWETWLDALSALASRALRGPDRVLALLTDLAPLGPVGPIGLPEVIRVLSDHLLELSRRPETSRYGRVFVAPTEAARGRRFDVVFVPGLAERLFPKEIREDPVLLDDARAAIAADASPRPLRLQEDRIGEERLALRLAVGAATRRVVLSYPRMDPIQSRPRVPSFYALEALRAAEGRLPLFEELRERADAVTEARVGWPAPRLPERAIDEAEYDLAVLESIHGRPILGRPGGGAPGAGGVPVEAPRAGGVPAEAPGAEEPDHTGRAHYLLTANRHLGRALRARAYRWSVRKWSAHDGLVKPSEAAAEALARYRPMGEGGRPVSATALQNYAVCPYKFFLSSVHRLAPRQDPAPIDSLDPLQKGSLIHEIMFETFSRLRAEDLLPVTEAGLEACLDRLDACVDDVAADHRERLVPAIDRVWEDGIEAIRADLRRWLRDVARAEGGWVPWRFELSFGVGRRAPRDPDSRPEPVRLSAGGADFALRGAIDLVERRADGALRVTDYKTGRVRVPPGARVDGGRHLQPVLYPLALEELVPGARVVSGRLYYCTAAGGFHVHEVPLDDDARRTVGEVVERVAEAVGNGFLPAAPDEGACRWCDYRPVCGPKEELRASRKDPVPGLAPLRLLR